MSTRSRMLAIGWLAIWIGAMAHPGAAAAKDDGVWPVKDKLVGEDDKKPKDAKKSTNVSGIACTSASGFPRACLVIDDNLQSAQLVTLKDGELAAGKSIRLIGNALGEKRLELDGEGVAYANGFFYVIGSHGHPRDKKGKLDPVADADKIGAKIEAASQIVRIRVKPSTGAPLGAAGAPDITRTAKLRPVIAAQPELAPHVDKRLDANGVTVEGIAVLGNRLFAGFRGPVVDGDRAAILSVALPSLFSDKAPDAKLSLLPLGKGQGVRDLAAFKGGLLILAGPVSDAGDGDYAIFWWDRVGAKPKLLKTLARYPDGDGQLKAEALLPLDERADRLRVLVLFDGAEEGGPRAIEIDKP